MRRRRRLVRRLSGAQAVVIPDVDLCRGPGNLTVALGINRRLNGTDLTSGPLRIEARPVFLLSALADQPLYMSASVNATWLLDL